MYLLISSLAAFCLLRHRKLENNILAGQLLVNGGKRLELGLDVDLVLGVKVHLQGLASVHLASGALADNLRGVHEVLEDSLLHGGERARAGAGSLSFGSAVVGRSVDGSLGNDDDMASRKLLLELPHEARLNLVKEREELEGNKQNDRLLRTGDDNLLGAKNVKVAELSLDLSGAHFKVKNLLGDLLLERIGGSAVGLDDLLASSEHDVYSCFYFSIGMTGAYNLNLKCSTFGEREKKSKRERERFIPFTQESAEQ